MMINKKAMAGLQIVLLVGMSFAIGMSFSEYVGVVRADSPLYPNFWSHAEARSGWGFGDMSQLYSESAPSLEALVNDPTLFQTAPTPYSGMTPVSGSPVPAASYNVYPKANPLQLAGKPVVAPGAAPATSPQYLGLGNTEPWALTGGEGGVSVGGESIFLDSGGSLSSTESFLLGNGQGLGGSSVWSSEAVAHQFGMADGSVMHGFKFTGEGGIWGVGSDGSVLKWGGETWSITGDALPEGFTAGHKFGLADGRVLEGVRGADGISGMTSEGALRWDPTAGAGGAWVSASPSPYYSYKPFGIEAFEIGGAAGWGGMTAHLVQGAVWAGVAVGIIQIAGMLFDLDKNLVDSLSWSAFGGIMTYKGLLSLTGGPATGAFGGGGLGVIPASFLPYIPWIGIGVAVAIFVFTYKKEKRELIVFECLSWQAPVGGRNCEKCNDNPLMPCSEYRCKSLGQACEIVNPGTNQEMCVWMHPEDTQAPKITVWNEALSPDDLAYSPEGGWSPPSGFDIFQRGTSDGCMQPYTRFEFGILTDEPAQCRVSYSMTQNYSEMQFLFGEDPLFLEEHTQKLKVPSPWTEEGEANVPEIHEDGTYTLWVRCIDANGNGEDSAAVPIRFCVGKGPDLKYPIIEGTSIENGQAVQHDASSTEIEVYVNEPANCKWSHEDKTYDLMENQMNCNTGSYSVNTELSYTCRGTLTGIENLQENNFYFRCEDMSTAEGGPNVMTSSYHLMLRGTEELTITSVGPDGTIAGSSDIVDVVLEVETAFGSDDGLAICSFSDQEENLATYTPMEGDYVVYHNQTIHRPAGVYTYYFQCVDYGGNSAFSNTTFTVEVDTGEPRVARVYRDGDMLKIITDEKAKCSYSLTSCNYDFATGLPTTHTDVTKKTVHYVDWDPSKTYHIKCEDIPEGNRPPPNQCSIVVQGSEI